MKRFLAAVLVIVSMFALMVPTFAANVCEEVKGDAYEEVTFTLKTNNKWWFTTHYATIKVTEGTAENAAGDDTYKSYGIFYIDVKEGSKNSKSYTMKGSSFKLKNLKANTEYTITVRPASASELDAANIFNFNWGFSEWQEAPAWTIGKTKNIELCGLE